MIVLGIETSGQNGGVALCGEDGIMGMKSIPEKENFSSLLIPVMDSLLKECKLGLKQISGIAVSLGPGSFTGLRIGLATAKGLAKSLGVPVAGVISLDAIARKFAVDNYGLCAVINAGRGEVYSAIYSMDKNGIKRVSKYAIANPQDIAKKTKNRTLFAGPGVEVIEKWVLDNPENKIEVLTQSRGDCFADAVAIAGLEKIKSGEIDDVSGIVPFYIKKSEAEVKWKKRKL